MSIPTKYQFSAFGEFNPSVYPNIRKDFSYPMDYGKIASKIATDTKLQALTLQAREALANGDEKAYSYNKALCGGFTPAAAYNGRRIKDCLLGLTAVAMVDLDHIPTEEMMAAQNIIRDDPHTFMSFITASGNGIRILYKYTTSSTEIAYFDAWKQGNEYYRLITRQPYDEATKDVSRISFFAYDPQCYFNPDSRSFQILSSEEQQEIKKSVSYELSSSEADDKASEILSRQGIHFVEGNRHRFLMQKLFLLNKMGVPEHEAEALIASQAPRGEHEAKELARWVYGTCGESFGVWKGKSPTQGKKVAQKGGNAYSEKLTKGETLAMIEDALKEQYQLRRNVLSNKYEIFNPESLQWEILTDEKENSIELELMQSLGVNFRSLALSKIIRNAHTPDFNPVEDYFASLPEWDGRDYISELASHVHTNAEEGVFLFCFKKWLVGTVAGWLSEDVVNETILTLISGQGMYKSTFFRKLLPPPLQEYFFAKTNSDYMSKDDKLALSQYLIIDLEEIDALRDKDTNNIKALTTLRVICERAAYARNRENRIHIASFCATGNNKNFLTDLTGNRRWLPFEVTSIDSPYEFDYHHAQLFAQCKHLLESNFQYWLTREEDLSLDDHRSEFCEPNIEEEKVLQIFKKPLNKPDLWEQVEFLSATDICSRIFEETHFQVSPRKVTQCMRRHGFDMRRTGYKRGFYVVSKTAEERAGDLRPKPKAEMSDRPDGRNE